MNGLAGKTAVVLGGSELLGHVAPEPSRPGNGGACGIKNGPRERLP